MTLPQFDIPPDGLFIEGEDKYITGVGQELHNIHSEEICQGRPCVIHHPSDHSMRSFPTNWRHGGIFDIKPPHMERICPHQIGHPDPDEIAEGVQVHGCDGCCR